MNRNNIVKARMVSWILLIFTSIMGIFLPARLGFSVDFVSFLPLYALAGAMAIFLPYTQWRKLTRLHVGLEGSVIILCCMAPLISLSYCAMRLDFPLADNRLGAMDASLGWSTASFVEGLQDHPRTGWMLSFAYSQLMWETLAMPFVLAAFGQLRRSYQFVSASIIVSLTVFICSAPFPSHGALVGQGVDPHHFHNISMKECLTFIKSFEAVRHSQHFVLSLVTCSGIITFPSLHAAMAALFIWAIWTVPIVRFPVIALNLAMMVSAPACGGHYLVDVIAANLVVLVSVKLATAERMPTRRPLHLIYPSRYSMA